MSGITRGNQSSPDEPRTGILDLRFHGSAASYNPNLSLCGARPFIAN
jgi:hypothetical protein